MSTEGLIYSHKIPLDEFCHNLIRAQAYAAWYFNSQVLFVSSASDLVHVVEDAHPYLAAHMDTLHDFRLSDSRYGLALCGHIACIINLIPTVSRQQEWTQWQLKTEEFNWDELNFNVSHCLPGEEEYTANASHCVVENDLHPFWMHSLLAPHHPQVAASSAKLSADVAHCSSFLEVYQALSNYDLTTRACYSTSVDPQSRGCWFYCAQAPVKRSMRSSKAIQPGPPAVDAKPTKPNCRTRASSRKTKAPPPAVSMTKPAKKSVFVGASDGEVESESSGESGAADATTPGIMRL
ncbi:hypothetical protein IW261DRAFT_1556849 [Armillaria novae-zelandiae]|uniref:Uncharacterized protein n=1 Tax=Armillaria novae-zelandiae TaxID=153914 RepID=A0AA39PXS0_9AGAR|nr:hypothetical protein IW261DRAFT_1556849 [Armillaria novae-zelandiae]